VFLGGAIVYAGFLWVFRHLVFEFLYAGKYLDYVFTPLSLICFIPTAMSLMVIWSGALRAIERPDKIFLAYLLACVFSLPIGAGLVVLAGVGGATGGILVFYVLAGLMTFVVVNRTLPHRPKEAD